MSYRDAGLIAFGALAFPLGQIVGRLLFHRSVLYPTTRES